MCGAWQVTGLMAMLGLMCSSCAQSQGEARPKFDMPVEHFTGVAKNLDVGPRLLLDNGSSITCIVETETGANAWPADVNNSRIRVEGYRIRSDSADPNVIVIRCVNWTRAAAPGESQMKTGN